MSDQNYQALVGSEVCSRDGAVVGSVEAIVSNEGQGPFLQVKDSGLFGVGADTFLVPVNAILSTDSDKITVNRSAQGMVGIPANESADPQDQGYFSSLFAWWGRPEGT